MRKLSPTAIDTFLESPAAFFWRYLHNGTGLQPLQQSVKRYDHDLIVGKIWAQVVDRFYRGIPLEMNIATAMADWLEQSDTWVPNKIRDGYAESLRRNTISYYESFSPTDGVRNMLSNPVGSELWVEDETFCGILDGISVDKVIHEVKLTGNTNGVADRVWNVQHSTQVKVYAFLTDASGVLVELGYKDAPYGVYRAEVLPFTAEQKTLWRNQYNRLADFIILMGTDPSHFPCTAEKCNRVTRGGSSPCIWRELCDGHDECMVFFEQRRERK